MGFDTRRILTLAGTLVLAIVVVVAGIYGPSAWKVLQSQAQPEAADVVIQTPPLNPEEIPSTDNPDITAPDTTTPDATAPDSSQTTTQPSTQSPSNTNTSGIKKYREPNLAQMDLAPSITKYFKSSGEGGLSDQAANIAFTSAWNIHQYVDGYLFGPTAGPQMNEEDIKKYIVFHKSLWDKQIRADDVQESALSNYISVLFNRGIDVFDTKDKLRIEQFHQEIHDLDAHVFRNDANSKTYGATPFATKR